jgi:hypothetical protein
MDSCTKQIPREVESGEFGKEESRPTFPNPNAETRGSPMAVSPADALSIGSQPMSSADPLIESLPTATPALPVSQQTFPSINPPNTQAPVGPEPGLNSDALLNASECARTWESRPPDSSSLLSNDGQGPQRMVLFSAELHGPSLDLNEFKRRIRSEAQDHSISTLIRLAFDDSGAPSDSATAAGKDRWEAWFASAEEAFLVGEYIHLKCDPNRCLPPSASWPWSFRIALVTAFASQFKALSEAGATYGRRTSEGYDVANQILSHLRPGELAVCERTYESLSDETQTRFPGQPETFTGKPKGVPWSGRRLRIGSAESPSSAAPESTPEVPVLRLSLPTNLLGRTLWVIAAYLDHLPLSDFREVLNAVLPPTPSDPPPIGLAISRSRTPRERWTEDQVRCLEEAQLECVFDAASVPRIAFIPPTSIAEVRSEIEGRKYPNYEAIFHQFCTSDLFWHSSLLVAEGAARLAAAEIARRPCGAQDLIEHLTEGFRARLARTASTGNRGGRELFERTALAFQALYQRAQLRDPAFEWLRRLALEEPTHAVNLLRFSSNLTHLTRWEIYRRLANEAGPGIQPWIVRELSAGLRGELDGFKQFSGTLRDWFPAAERGPNSLSPAEQCAMSAGFHTFVSDGTVQHRLIRELLLGQPPDFLLTILGRLSLANAALAPGSNQTLPFTTTVLIEALSGIGNPEIGDPSHRWRRYFSEALSTATEAPLAFVVRSLLRDPPEAYRGLEYIILAEWFWQARAPGEPGEIATAQASIVASVAPLLSPEQLRAFRKYANAAYEAFVGLGSHVAGFSAHDVRSRRRLKDLPARIRARATVLHTLRKALVAIKTAPVA